MKCTECGNDLIYYEERIDVHYRKINKGGKLSKRVSKNNSSDLGAHGIICTECRTIHHNFVEEDGRIVFIEEN